MGLVVEVRYIRRSVRQIYTHLVRKSNENGVSFQYLSLLVIRQR